MNGIWIFALCLTVVLGTVLQPLFSRRGNRPLPQGLEGDPWRELEAQRDRLLLQLKEWQLEPDRTTGAAAIQTEVEQELAAVLARLDRLGRPTPAGKSASGAGEGSNRPDMGWAIALLVLLVGLTAAVYQGLGGAGAVPTQAAQEMPDAAMLQQMVERLAQRLEQEPDNIPGWLKLARSQAVLGNSAGAMASYRHVLSRPGEHAEAVVGLAALQVQSGVAEQLQQGVTTLEALLAKNPTEPEALWLLGAVAARAGEYARAIELWQRLLPQLPAGSDPRLTVEGAIQEAQAQQGSR
ncbi:MAG: tetratricopeptide repeat protein [Magnetococcales bacterium]|nr:tetratricopeptide repeat protein [Magnetococcales bacterium]